jgi:hypothetical protein
MPASKAEQVLDALKALLETVPYAVVQRNSVLPEKIPGDGLIILRDGDPGEPEQALGAFKTAYYRHAVEIEVYVEEGDGATRDAALPPPADRCCARSRPNSQRSRFWPDLRPARAGDRGDRGRAGAQEATLTVTADYETDAPLS